MKKTTGIITIIFVLIAGATLSQASPFTINGQECIPNEILVKFEKGLPIQNMKAIVSKLGGLDIQASRSERFTVVTIPEGKVQKFIRVFESHPAIIYAEPNYIMRAFLTPNDEYFSFQWHMTQINIEDAWDNSTGEGITIAVLDSGISPYGIDGFGSRLQQGYNAFWMIEGYTEDFNFHGTHVAGTIGQETNNTTGVAGIAYNANILPVKVLNRFGTGSVAVVLDGLYWAADNGADIINMSLGGENTSQALEESVQYAYNKGIIMIAASGNESGPIGYPAAYPEVIAVGALDYNKDLAPYSNFGPEQDFVAPGGDTTQDSNDDGYSDGVVQESFFQYLGFRNFAIGWALYFLNGTSQAAPHVAGVAALLLSKNPDWGYDEVMNALKETTEDLGSPGKDDLYGYGLINAAAALNYTE